MKWAHSPANRRKARAIWRLANPGFRLPRGIKISLKGELQSFTEIMLKMNQTVRQHMGPRLVKQLTENNEILRDMKFKKGKRGKTIRIRLPQDFTVKDTFKLCP